MKLEEEIRKEIEATKTTMEKYRKAYKDGCLPFEVLENKVNDCSATIDALRWVLGENDRYD